MKSSIKLIGWMMAGFFLLAAGNLWAQPASPVAAPAPALPDLVIEKIFLDQSCNVAVVVKNLGPGHVPDAVWTVHTPKSAGVYLYRNGTGWGGASIWKFDPAKALQKPGGTATYYSNLKVTTAVGIKAVVDLHNTVKEANETNNSQATKLVCEQPAGSCCIAGIYEGVHKDMASATCKPKTEKFIFILTQANCGSGVEGQIKSPKDGAMVVTHTFKGVVTSVEKCCELKGEIREISTGKTTPIKATLCLKNGKYYTTNGSYNDPAGCSGTFEMHQI
ncbi:MAG: hypothetical protein EHM45_12435 [Desulfobacteraceae bacterium]|nr:MAG: hypothetical protein EHM45_12435 [Desulfobacteraceae bacterium]